MYATLLASFFLLPAQASEPPAAMVLVTKGAVTFERGKEKPRRLGAMTLLAPGDRVQVPAGAEVTLVLLADGERERLKGDVTINAKGCQPAGNVERLKATKLPATSLENLRDLANSSRGSVGVMRGEEPKVAQLVTPLYGATIQTDRPDFTWKDINAEAYLVQLFSGAEGKDQRVIWKAIVKDPRLAYPEKEKRLQLGLKYRWRVTPMKADDASAEPIVESKFLILTKGEIELLANLKPLQSSKDPADLLLAAVSFEAHGAYDDALRLYERLATMAPTEANYQTTLASYYDRAGRKDLATQARARAKKLAD